MRTKITLPLIAVLAWAVAAIPASAQAPRGQQEIHLVEVTGGPSQERHHVRELWLTATTSHSVTRDADTNAIILEDYANTRTGRRVDVDYRRDVRHDGVAVPCAKRWLEIEREIPQINLRKLQSGEYTVVGRRTLFGRPVLDVTGDLGEWDVGPAPIEATIDEQTGYSLALSARGEQRSYTTTFEVRKRSAWGVAEDMRLSNGASAVKLQRSWCDL